MFYEHIDEILYLGVRPDGYDGPLERGALAAAARMEARAILNRRIADVDALTEALLKKTQLRGTELRNFLAERR